MYIINMNNNKGGCMASEKCTMVLGKGIYTVSVFTVISFGVRTFIARCGADETLESDVIHQSHTLDDMVKWYWSNNAVYVDSWESLIDFVHNWEQHTSDERPIYIGQRDQIFAYMYELAYYMVESEYPTLNGFICCNFDE